MEKFAANLSKKQKASLLLYGLFFEDINHSLDGGLNANLIQNGSFNFCYFTYDKAKPDFEYDGRRFWTFDPSDKFVVTKQRPLSKNKNFSIKASFKQNETAVMKNLGYEICNGENFIYLSASKCICAFNYLANDNFKIKTYLQYKDGRKSQTNIQDLPKTSKFAKISFEIACKKDKFAHIVFELSGKGQIQLTNFSLVPENYFKSDKNAYNFGKFNPKLVKALDIGAKFFRFPGGCLVEGDVSTDYLYEWEKTIGPLEERGHKPSVWNYLQSNDIGFFEYFCLCEDLNLSPLPVHHVGLICQIRTEVFRHEGYKYFPPESKEFKEKVVDSVAHLIYFAKGSTSSKDKTEKEWAGKRKQMGHPKPFKLEMIALGNENWDEVYFKNFDACVEALKGYKYCGKKTDIWKKFKVQPLTSAGVGTHPQDTNPSWKFINQNYDNLVVDEHCYSTFEWFVDNFYRYDFYNPQASKVFMGEYACHTDADGKGRLGGRNTFGSALAEAVFMCGMENNPQTVKMSCYAPLLCKKGQGNWDPDLIYFDEKNIYFTPNYYVQKFFVQNYGKYSVRLETDVNKTNAGKFAFVGDDKNIKNIEFFDLDNNRLNVQLGQNLESDENLENFAVQIAFKRKAKSFSVQLGKVKKTGFGYFLHYDDKTRHLYYEKTINNVRVAYEDLGKVNLGDNLRIYFTTDKIEVANIENDKQSLIASKQIWKNHSKVFTSMTFDEQNVYLKAVNTSTEAEDVAFNFDEKLFENKRATGQQIVLLQKPEDEMSILQKKKSLNFDSAQLKTKLPPFSINIFVLKR